MSNLRKYKLRHNKMNATGIQLLKVTNKKESFLTLLLKSIIK